MANNFTFSTDVKPLADFGRKARGFVFVLIERFATYIINYPSIKVPWHEALNSVTPLAAALVVSFLRASKYQLNLTPPANHP